VPHDWVGKTIGGRYQIESLLGQGGMSAVYRAVDPNLRRMVAIKLIHPHLSVNPNFVNRFKEEAAAVARLRHPNIVQVHDFDQDGDTYYMVMEYLIGETLQARLKRLDASGRHMPFPEAARVCLQLCGAVGYAHKHELIHRDIKPANVMLDLNGQPILMDFGIVKIVGGEYHTATGATIGTAMYMSPEQIRSERLDERADIYSLGVTLYEMVSGRTPYQADSVMTLMMMVLNDPLPDLRESRPGIPESLVAIIEKALAKDPLDRYQTMEQMAVDLEQVADSLHSATEVVTEVDESQVPESTSDAAPPAELAELQERSTEPEQVEVPTTGPAPLPSHPPATQGKVSDGSAPPTVQDLPPEPIAAMREIETPKPRRALRLGRRTVIITVTALLLLGIVSVIAIIYINSTRPPALQLTTVSQPPLAITDQTAQFVVSLGSWSTSSSIEELAYSPDGKLLGTVNNRDWVRFSDYRFYGVLWDVGAGALQNYLLGHTAWIYSLDFSPDGQLLATGADDTSLILWRISDGSFIRKIETQFGGITGLDFSPNNLLLAAGSWDGVVGLWQVRDGQLLRSLQGHENSVRDVAFSPDGNLIASASDDNTVILWGVSDGSLLHALPGHTASVLKIVFSPDGTLLASASEDGTVGIWQVSDGSQVRTLRGHSETVYDIDFSPDGSLLASASGDTTLRLWSVTDGELLQMLAGGDEGIISLAFSPAGHLLVSAAGDGVLRFWGLSEAIPLETQTTRP